MVVTFPPKERLEPLAPPGLRVGFVLGGDVLFAKPLVEVFPPVQDGLPEFDETRAPSVRATTQPPFRESAFAKAEVFGGSFCAKARDFAALLIWRVSGVNRVRFDFHSSLLAFECSNVAERGGIGQLG